MKVPRIWRRKSDAGHMSVFSSKVVGPAIQLKWSSLITGGAVTTTLSKEDARDFAKWLQEKCK